MPVHMMLNVITSINVISKQNEAQNTRSVTNEKINGVPFVVDARYHVQRLWIKAASIA